MKSDLFSINWRDAFKSTLNALFAALFSAIGLVLSNKIETHDFTLTILDAKMILMIALSTFVGSIAHRYFTDGEGRIMGKL